MKNLKKLEKYLSTEFLIYKKAEEEYQCVARFPITETRIHPSPSIRITVSRVLAVEKVAQIV